MTQQEFTARTGIEPSGCEWNTIEDMYLAAGNMGKDEFCDAYKIIGTAPLVKELHRQTASQRVTIGELTNKIQELKNKIHYLAEVLIDQASKNADYNLYNEAVRAIGQRNVTLYKIENDFELWDEDHDYIKEKLLSYA